MLELQQRQMPHAVQLWTPSKYSPNRQYLHQNHTAPVGTLPQQKSNFLPAPVPSANYHKQTRSHQARPPTPPQEMSILHGAPVPQPGYGSALSSLPNGSSMTTNTSLLQSSSRSASRQASPTQRRPSADGQKHQRKTSNNDIAPSLRIPSTIQTPQTGMPQLAAEITCLFWFENSSTLLEVVKSHSPSLPSSPLVPDATPTTGFRKWVATILSTTQVAQNVILLALLFVYRLKKINPSVKGKPGSEYRLLTVALMLGNKFLDDNTYTNKTWAEVSGISVLEVHIMEVEFLSNMRYSLYTSEEEWKEWHQLLGKFGTFFDKASRLPLEVLPRLTAPPTPTLHMPPALPSPPTSNHASPPFLTGYSPNYAHQQQQPPQLHSSTTPLLLPQVASTSVSPIGPLPEIDARANNRKRSRDEPGLYESPAKRPAPARNTSYQPPPLPTNVAAMAGGPTLPRLPNLSIPFPQVTAPVGAAPVPLPPQLPPLGTRAMSMVFPPAGQAPSVSQPPSFPPTTSNTPIPPPPQLAIPGPTRGDHSRQLSPYHGVGSHDSSPVNASFPPAPQTPNNPSHLSPSYFLAQRQSPYRPVRTVSTLLHPPPTASMQHNPGRVPLDMMQYQPLGRPAAERRAGHVPYMHMEAWPQTNQLNQWPVLPQPLPQPNFHR